MVYFSSILCRILPIFAIFLSRNPRASAESGAADAVFRFQPEEDRYKLVLNRSDSETVASNYFRPTRASRILLPDPTTNRGRPAFSPVLPAFTLVFLIFYGFFFLVGWFEGAFFLPRLPRPQQGFFAGRGLRGRLPTAGPFLSSFSSPGAGGGSQRRLPPAPALPPPGSRLGPADTHHQAQKGQSRPQQPPPLTPSPLGFPATREDARSLRFCTKTLSLHAGVRDRGRARRHPVLSRPVRPPRNKPV